MAALCTSYGVQSNPIKKTEGYGPLTELQLSQNEPKYNVWHNIWLQKLNEEKATRESMTCWYPWTTGHSLNWIMSLWNFNVVDKQNSLSLIRISGQTTASVENRIAQDVH